MLLSGVPSGVGLHFGMTRAMRYQRAHELTMKSVVLVDLAEIHNNLAEINKEATKIKGFRMCKVMCVSDRGISSPSGSS